MVLQLLQPLQHETKCNKHFLSLSRQLRRPNEAHSDLRESSVSVFHRGSRPGRGCDVGPHTQSAERAHPMKLDEGRPSKVMNPLFPGAY